MKLYIRFEIENHEPWARNHLMGVYLDAKDNEKKERLLCFNSCIPKEKNNILLEELCLIYNKKLEALNEIELRNNIVCNFSFDFLGFEWLQL